MRNREWGRRLRIIFLAVTGIFLAAPVVGAEDPDELYRQGRFAEAEKIYARSDMDNPKDLRHRYNRGCANYQASDYKGAMAAFSSVLKRATDKQTRLKAVYNLGNTVFKEGEIASAAGYYKQAILLDPENENARYNLEIALRELEKLKKKKEEAQKSSGQEGGEKKDPSKEGEKKKREEESPPDKPSKENGLQDKGSDGKSADRKPDTEEPPKDLSGELRPSEVLPEKKEQVDGAGQAVSLMDKKKAEALLDNVKEDRSKFLEFQAPKGRRHGVLSGKDW